MKRNLIIILLTLFITSAFAQRNVDEGGKYKLNGPIKVSVMDGNECTSDTVTICADNKIKVVRIIDGTVRLSPKTTYSKTSSDGTEICNTDANENMQYCILEEDLLPNIKIPEILPTYGMLSVPFKFQTKDFQIYSSGNLGGFFGIQKRLNWDPFGEDSYWFLVGTAGYSLIPLNNVNSTDPENVEDVGALSYGISTGLAFGRFQVMFIKGWDKYNVNDSKQNRSWISVGLGFGFLKPPSKEK